MHARARHEPGVTHPIEGADGHYLSDGCSRCERNLRAARAIREVGPPLHTRRLGTPGAFEEREAPGPNWPLSVRVLSRRGRRRRGSTAPRPRCLRPTRQWLVSDWWRRRAHASWASVPVRPALADVPSPSTRARARRLVSMAQADGAVLTLVRVGLHLSASAPPHSIRVRARAAGAPAVAPRDDALQESCGRGTRPL